MDIERLRRGRQTAPEENGNLPPEEGYWAFRIADSYEPQRRMVIRCAKRRRQLIPLYDLLYDIVADLDGRFLALIYPFVTIKLYGRHLGELERALTWHICTRIEEFDPASDRFPEGLNENGVTVVTDIVIEGDEADHGMDAEAEARKYRASGEKAEP